MSKAGKACAHYDVICAVDWQGFSRFGRSELGTIGGLDIRNRHDAILRLLSTVPHYVEAWPCTCSVFKQAVSVHLVSHEGNKVLQCSFLQCWTLSGAAADSATRRCNHGL